MADTLHYRLMDAEHYIQGECNSCCIWDMAHILDLPDLLNSPLHDREHAVHSNNIAV